MRKLIKKILKEDFEWAEDIPSEPGTTDEKIHVGAVYKINPERNNIDMELEVIDITRHGIEYRIIKSDEEGELVGDVESVSYTQAKSLLEPQFNKGPYWLYDKYQSKRLK